MNPIYNGNWPEIVIQRTEFRDQLANELVSRLPKFTQAEIERIKGTSDYLGINYYHSNLIADIAEEIDGVLSYDTDVRVSVGIASNWTTGFNNSTVSLSYVTL